MTLPVGFSTTVVFVRAGVEVARAEAPGHLLEINLPSSVVLERIAPDHVRLVETSDPLLECCGLVGLPWVSSTGLGVASLLVPSPAPFTDDDITVMWQARNRLTARRRAPTSGAAAWSALERAVGQSVDWPSVEQALAAASQLLGQWPRQNLPTVRWLPPERTGGRELVGVTERSKRVHRAPGAGRRPAETARRTTRSADQTLHSLAAVAHLLAESIYHLTGIDSEPVLRDAVVGTFHRVAVRSHSARRAADPPSSVWSDTFVTTYSACLRALATANALGPGQESAPLSEVWELYEAWTAEHLLEEISLVLGESQPSKNDTCIGRWSDGAGTIELHYQPHFPTSGPRTLLGHEYTATIGDLVPDLCLVRVEGGAARMLVLDAKKRAGGLLLDDLVTHSSKYLWGIRRVDAIGTTPVLEQVVLLTSVGGVNAGRAEGRARAATAHPRHGFATGLVGEILAAVR